MQELDSPVASNGAGYLFPLEFFLKQNIKFNRLEFHQNAFKTLQNGYKNQQTPTNQEKYVKWFFAVFESEEMRSFHHEELVSQLTFDQTLDVVKQVFAATVIWFANSKHMCQSEMIEISFYVPWLPWKGSSHYLQLGSFWPGWCRFGVGNISGFCVCVCVWGCMWPRLLFTRTPCFSVKRLKRPVSRKTPRNSSALGIDQK